VRRVMLISFIALLSAGGVAACGDDEPAIVAETDGGGDGDAGGDGDGDGDGDAGDVDAGGGGLTLRSDITPVTRVQDAKEGVFIPPFEDCREPRQGDTGEGPNGQVCTNVAISGCTEEGKRFADYADCDIVLTQRPFWPRPPAGESDPNDPRLEDDAYLEELAWVTSQVESAGCVCCHDSTIVGGMAGIWDIRLGPLWLDSVSDSGLALFVGLADSSVLGAYPKEDNHGFDRMLTGLPTTDTERMQAFLRAEMEHRGLTEEEARAVPPFGGPIYANSVAEPEPCEANQGVDEDGTVRWIGGPARYVYVLEGGSKNPGVPPNLDMPEGTLWRLDVLPSADAVASGLRYGTTPAGSFQAIPETSTAPALEEGASYHLVALADVGLPVTSCLFTYGETSGGGDAGTIDYVDPSVCDGEMTMFGSTCRNDNMCRCDAASFCAIQPGQTDGFCTATGCVEDPGVCPEDWSCFDVSMFQAGAPSFCLAPP
jgi:hypothetical protein